MLAGTVITVQSCVQTEENGNMIMTEVDKFIASPGYQAFWANERNKDYEKAQIMMQLPEEIYGTQSGVSFIMKNWF